MQEDLPPGYVERTTLLGGEVWTDEDGFSALVVAGDHVPVPLWRAAHDEHSVALLLSLGTGAALDAERFVLERVEVSSLNAYRVRSWQNGDLPTMRGYLEALDRQAAAVDGDLGTFVNLHNHTEYSPLDGLSLMSEVFSEVGEHGERAVGFTDHGNCAGHPEAQALSDQTGIKAVFGMEAYFQPDRFRRTRRWAELDGVEVDPEHLSPSEAKRVTNRSDSEEARWGYFHLSLWAGSQVGLRNLWSMSTESYRDGYFDGKARLDWDTLDRLGEDVVCGTGCLRGPVARAIVEGDMDVARDRLLRLMGIFGDRLYVELHCNTLDDQVRANEGLVVLAREFSLPLMMAVDSHYPTPEKKPTHEMWVAMQQGKTLAEDTGMFSGGQDYHLMTEAEVRSATAYLGPDVVDEAVANTVVIARRCTAEVRGESNPPVFTRRSVDHPDVESRVARDVERIAEVCRENWERRTRGKPYTEDEARARMDREMRLLVSKRFVGYFLIVWDYVSWAKREGCLVGPSRGSGGGSYVAYLMGITETDPIKEDLIFERFLTEGRTSLPDFDIDFPASWKGRVINYIRERWGGDEHTSNIGTVLRLRSKAAVNDVARVLTNTGVRVPSYTELEAIKALVAEADAPLAGKHMPWDEFCDQFSHAIDPMRTAYPEFFNGVDHVVDRLKTYGKHAAGIVVSPDSPLTDLPMFMTEVEERVDGRKVKTQMLVTQFDMNALEGLGYIKFDILTLRTLDTLQACVDLVHERLGRRVDPYDWVDEFEDPQVWEQVCEGRTLGMFQVETPGGTQMVRRMQPKSLQDLAAVVTIVRPGPKNSGLTDMFLRRRAGVEPVSYPDPRMEGFVGDTYGAMIYQEQVMAACMTLAGYSSDEADAVRKILGKKLVEKVETAGREFVSRAVSNQTDPEVATLLWGQMAEFAKYGFGKAHAFAYAVLGVWTSWLKFHFPREFMLACMSTVDNDRVPEFIDECRLLGYRVALPDVNRSDVTFTSDGVDVLYGLMMVKNVGEAAARHVVQHQPYASLEDFLSRCVEPKGSPVNMGHVRHLVEVGAFDSLVPNRRALEVQLERDASGESRRCTFKVEVVGAHGLPCSFDWAAEPDPPTLRKRVDGRMQTVSKPPPKRCTTACRQYLAPERLDPVSVPPYTLDEVMSRERELLGVWVSASPWDRADPDLLERSDTASTIESGPAERQYLGVCIVDRVKTRTDVNGNTYAFVTLNMQDGRVEPICFSSVYSSVSTGMDVDDLGVAVIWKNARGLQLADYTPYPTTQMVDPTLRTPYPTTAEESA